MGDQGDCIEGSKELALALQSLPDNGEIKQLITEFKGREPEQIERERLERLNRPKLVYDTILERFKDANLFDDHSLKTSKPAKDAAEAITSALLYTQPAYKITVNTSPRSETYEILGQQDVSGNLFNAGSLRRFLINVNLIQIQPFQVSWIPDAGKICGTGAEPRQLQCREVSGIHQGVECIFIYRRPRDL